jgi:hypothetical protein
LYNAVTGWWLYKNTFATEANTSQLLKHTTAMAATEATTATGQNAKSGCLLYHPIVIE